VLKSREDITLIAMGLVMIILFLLLHLNPYYADATRTAVIFHMFVQIGV
jgi:hypothetical protein